MSKNIEKALAFIKSEFDTSDYFKAHENDKEYRFRHSMRVANIGAEIARKENLNVEALTIACLLHDVSYRHEFITNEDWKGHGRRASKMVREFLKDLDFSDAIKEDICYGVAIHVDDEADFEGERTPFALSVGDADNIDRFDVYRIYENLQYSQFSNMKHEDQLVFVEQKCERLAKLMNMELGTQTAKELWCERVSYQIDFFNRLKDQLNQGEQLTYLKGE